MDFECKVRSNAPDYAGILIHCHFSDHIYFDGYLPIQKRDIRLGRLESNRKELLAFQANNTTGLTISFHSAQDSSITVTAAQLLDSSSTPSLPYRGVPAPPFLVACVIEELLQSQYSSATSVVYWEADTLCADAARRASPGAVVLMSDSDYLVHDLGSHSSSGFFNKLELKSRTENAKHSNTCQTLEVPTFQNRSVAERLGLRDLKRFGFEVRNQPSITLNDAIHRTVPPPSDAAQFKAFLAEYDMPWEGASGSQLVASVIHPLLQESTLDPRISELILQMKYHTVAQAVNMYLPVLLEDPRRTSAWTGASEDRLFAYSCIHQYSYVKAKRGSIWEFFRKGDRVASEEMELLDKAQIQAHALKLLASISGSKDHYAWRQHALSRIRTPEMTIEELANVLKGNPRAHNWSWKDIQNHSRMEAVLYSLRTVQQVLRILVKMLAHLPQPLLDLERTLATLPPLKVMMASRLEILQRG